MITELRVGDRVIVDTPNIPRWHGTRGTVDDTSHRTLVLVRFDRPQAGSTSGNFYRTELIRLCRDNNR